MPSDGRQLDQVHGHYSLGLEEVTQEAQGGIPVAASRLGGSRGGDEGRVEVVDVEGALADQLGFALPYRLLSGGIGDWCPKPGAIRLSWEVGNRSAARIVKMRRIAVEKSRFGPGDSRCQRIEPSCSSKMP